MKHVMEKWAVTLVAVSMLCLVGCGGGEEGPKLVAAGGTVKYNGAAVEGATVTLVFDGGQTATGATGKDGTFTLTANEAKAMGQGYEANQPVPKEIKVEALARTVRMLREKGFTIIMVEQNFRFAAPLADRFYVMEHGRMVEGFAASELPARMDMLHEYLGV